MSKIQCTENYCSCDKAYHFYKSYTAQKIKFSVKDFFSKCDQIRRKLWIWSHLPKKLLMENSFLCSDILLDLLGKMDN